MFENLDSKKVKENIINLIRNDSKFFENNKNIEDKFSLKDWGLSLEINESLIDNILKKPFIYKGISFDNKKHELTDIGLGHLRIIILKMLDYILKNNKNDKETILLIDEPEAFLHPNLIKEVCNIFKELMNNKITIILTTHSPLIISELKEYLCNFRKLTYDKVKTCIELSPIIDKNNLLEKYKEVYFDFANKESNKLDSLNFSALVSLVNFDFCRLFFVDKIIGVEGISEYLAFSFDNFNKLFREKIGDYEIIPMHGLRNLPLMYTLFHFFNKEFIILCDNDEIIKPNAEYTTKIKNLINKDYKEIVLINEGELEHLLGINTEKATEGSDKPANIIWNKEIIDTDLKADKVLTYLKLLQLE